MSDPGARERFDLDGHDPTVAGPRIYLDHNGSTPVTPGVARAITAFLEGHWGNAGAGHPDGRAARRAIDDARARIAAVLGASDPESLTLTSGGTESNNHAVLGVAEAALARGDRRRHVVCGRHEHQSVLQCVVALERRGFEVSWVDPAPDGALRPSDVEAAIREDTLLVCVMFANNETGRLQPVREAAAAAHARGALLFVDAVCGVGKLPIDVGDLDCDLLSLAGHKVHAPKGIGALWVRDGVDVAPFLLGCGQQGGRRSGTENTMGAVGLAAAMELHGRPGPVASADLRALRDRLLGAALDLGGVQAQRNGEGPDLPNTCSLWFPGHDSLTLQKRLGAAGLSATAQAKRPKVAGAGPKPSHVLIAMGHGPERALESLRFSLGSTTTSDEIDAAIHILHSTFQRARP